MKNIFQLFLFMLCLQLRSQTEVVEPKGRFDIGFSASPDYSYRILKAETADKWMKNTYDTAEIARVGFTAGLQVVFHASEKLFFTSGVLFSDRGEKTKKYLTPPVNNYINHYYYLSIPLRANYYLIQKKIKLFLSAGVSADVYLKSFSVIEFGSAGETRSLGLSSEISRLNLMVNAGFGIDCPITDRWYFKFQPDYRMSITPVSDSPIKKYFYSFGLNMGFFYRF
jgi:hypothetical protein